MAERGGRADDGVPGGVGDIVEVLRGFRLLRSEILTAGGGLSPISQGINAAFGARGWREEKFETRIVVGDTEYASRRMRWTASRGGWRWSWSGTTRTRSSTAT